LAGSPPEFTREEILLAIYIILLVVCVLLSAFFAMAETSFISLQRARLMHEVGKGVRGASSVLALVKDPAKLLSTILLGNNLANAAAAALATTITVRLMGDTNASIVVATVGVTAVLLIFGDITPKTIAAHHADRLSKMYAPPVRWLSWLFSPFVWVLSMIASGITKLLGQRYVPRSLASEDEIRAMIAVGEKEGALEAGEAEMLQNIFEFTDRPVREVMTPRPEVVFVPYEMTVKEFLDLYRESPLSRYPVYRETRDRVVGTLALKDVLMALSKEGADPGQPVGSLVRAAYFAPVTKRTGDLFREMRDKNFHLSVIVDEYGGTAGVVSLSRMLEEIVGPVGDELSPSTSEYQAIDSHTYEIDAGMQIEDANEQMQLDLPEGEYETVAGFILSLLGRVPRVDDQLRFRDLRFTIKEMEGVKIKTVLVTREKHAKAAS